MTCARGCANACWTRWRRRSYDVVCAHSLGSLVAYDTFARNPGAIADKVFVTLGSQIGNPFVRDCFAGRIQALKDARMWYHLFNKDDHVFTARIRLEVDNFAQVATDFDKPSDVINHDPLFYLNHPNTQSRVWQYVSGATVARSIDRTFNKLRAVAKRPNKRALLVGINEYPDKASRLEGCVNDVFLMSSLLQECGIEAEDIRVVLDERATTAGILERMHWLLDDVPPDGERILFYSGHGAQLPSYGLNGEVDHLDECLVPWDFNWDPVRAIRDKQFVEFYSQLRYDTKFVAIFDCCHSGRHDARRRPEDPRHHATRRRAPSRDEMEPRAWACGRSAGCRRRIARSRILAWATTTWARMARPTASAVA